MLSLSSIKQATNLLSEFQVSNKKLQLEQGSPIIPLVHSITTLNETGSDNQLLQASMMANTTEGTHGELEEAYKKKLSSILNTIIFTAKNKINPLIRDILKQIEETRQINALSSVRLMGDIKIVETPDLLTDNYFINLIENYKLTPPAKITAYNGLINKIINECADTEIKQLVQTSITNLDLKLESFLKDDYTLYSTDNFNLDHINKLTLRNAALLFFVIVGLEKTPENPFVVENPTVIHDLVELKASIGGFLCREIEQLQSVLKADELVVRYNFIFDSYIKEQTLYVYADSYKAWLSKGGSPEAALGYLALNGNRYTYVKDIELKTNPEKYYNEYKVRLERASVLNALDDVNLTRNITRDYLATYISQSLDVDKELLHKRLADNIQREYYGIGQTIEFVTKVVCRTFTKGEEVKNLLLEIDAVLSNIDTTDKEKALEKAVYLAVIRLTARWLKSNLIIIKQ